jgi:hypothetical protein
MPELFTARCALVGPRAKSTPQGMLSTCRDESKDAEPASAKLQPQAPGAGTQTSQPRTPLAFATRSRVRIQIGIGRIGRPHNDQPRPIGARDPLWNHDRNHIQSPEAESEPATNQMARPHPRSHEQHQRNRSQGRPQRHGHHGTALSAISSAAALLCNIMQVALLWARLERPH